MNNFSTILDTWHTRLAFWRKPESTLPDQADAPETHAALAAHVNEAEPSAIPPAKSGWFARLKQAFQNRRKETPALDLDPDKTVIMERPSREQLEASGEIAAEPLPKPSLMTRLRNHLRRKPKLEVADEIREPADANERKRATSATNSESADAQSATEDAPTTSIHKRLILKLQNKWVWIPSASVLLLSLVGAALYIVLQTAQEKAKLQAELKSIKQQLQKQAASAKKAPVPVTAIPNLTAPPKADQAATIVGQANTKPIPPIDSGDCLVTDIESVTKNLKDCIESFNNASPSPRQTHRKK